MTADITQQTYSSKSTAHRGAIRAGYEPIDFRVVSCHNLIGRWKIELRTAGQAPIETPAAAVIECPEARTEIFEDHLGEDTVVVETPIFEEDKIEGIGHTRYQRHKELLASDYTHTHVEASWSDDGDAENGPHLSGGPAYDEYSLRDGDTVHLVRIDADGKEDYQQEPAWMHDGPSEEIAAKPTERDELGKMIANIETPAQLNALTAALAIIAKARPVVVSAPKAEKKAKTPKTPKEPKAKVVVEATAEIKEAAEFFGLAYPRQKHLDALAAAHRGELPTEPSFEQPSYQPHKKTFDKIKALVDAGNGDAVETEARALTTGWTIRKRIQEYGLLAAIALKARQ
jgi:hypothetical protein